MDRYADVPAHVHATMRAICTALPDAYEEVAWTGTRWCVRKRTFAHVLALAAGSSAHSKVARIARTDADVVIVTFRAPGLELDALRHAGPPFFYAGWGRDVVGMVIGPAVDWDEVRELMTESYCVLAPKKLVALVDRPAVTELDDD